MYTDAEWMLKPSILHDALHKQQFKPDIDLFASRLNKQLKQIKTTVPTNQILVHCISMPFLFHGTTKIFPVSLLLVAYCRCYKKIIHEKAEGILVVPNWATQPWYQVLEQILVKEPTMVPPSKQTLVLPARPKRHTQFITNWN